MTVGLIWRITSDIVRTELIYWSLETKSEYTSFNYSVFAWSIISQKIHSLLSRQIVCTAYCAVVFHVDGSDDMTEVVLTGLLMAIPFVIQRNLIGRRDWFIIQRTRWLELIFQVGKHSTWCMDWVTGLWSISTGSDWMSSRELRGSFSFLRQAHADEPGN